MGAIDSYIIKCAIAVFYLFICLYLCAITGKIGINLACMVGICGG